MTQLYFGRALVLFAVVIVQPAIGQSDPPDVGRYETRPQASFLLAAAEMGAAGDASVTDQGKRTSDAPSKAAPEGDFFRIDASQGLFGGSDPSRSLGQQSATAGYELRGSGADVGSFPGGANALTAPVRGDAVSLINGVLVYPSLSASIAYNDNVLLTPVNAVSSVVYTMVPGVIAELKSQGDRYTASFLGNSSRYVSSPDDNYNHYDLSLAGDQHFSSRTRLGWSLGRSEGSDPRGSTDRAISPDPDRWQSSIAHGLFAYGAVNATGRVELDGSVEQKRYVNNRATTVGSDVNIEGMSGRFFYRVMPKTSLLFEMRNTRADYVQDVLVNSNTERRYYAGAAWDATGKTTGSVKFGWLTKDFPGSSRQDYSGWSWEGVAHWTPLTYSAFDLITSRGTADSTGVGDYILNTGMSMIWTHKWKSYFSTRISVGILKSEFPGASRQDDTRDYDFGVFYELNRRLRAGVDWAYTDRNSNQSINAFKRNVLMLSIEGTL